jgi:MoaA/NifB/PqqE/SkfB family radical SAM enzyme
MVPLSTIGGDAEKFARVPDSCSQTRAGDRPYNRSSKEQVEGFGWRYLTEHDRAQILAGIEQGRALGGPYHAEIHPADRCNIECFFCSTAAIRGTDELPLQRIDELISELDELGTRSVRLSGGGEPLFHRQTAPLLERIAASRMRIENLTTNGVLLGDRVTDALLRSCDRITVSLNTADPKSYASMMQTPERNFSRVVENVRKLLELRRGRKGRTPEINLQFLVWKENFRTIPEMYDLGASLGVDTILFNGLAFLRDDQKMTAEETGEMMSLYRAVVRNDEYRRIRVIENYEQDISALIEEMNADLARERASRGTLRRLMSLLARNDFTFAEKVRHHRRMRQVREVSAAHREMDDGCVIGWHSLVVRTTGAVAPCCILQDAQLGNVFRSTVREVWYGEPYERFRGELSSIIRQRSSWRHDPQRDATVVPMCGSHGGERCPIKSSYYAADLEFSRKLDAITRRS